LKYGVVAQRLERVKTPGHILLAASNFCGPEDLVYL
jgi:hypothetical protein